uniref:Ig-like domain-containing protein n=1 Tax=Salvator merianae TaxID=96440 RepID=A0A8D0C5F1_SALMN
MVVEGRTLDLEMVYLPLLGSPSEIQLTESGNGMLKPGESLRLSCSVTGFSVSGGHGWSWIHQPERKGLEWLGCHPTYSPAFQSPISISADASKNEYYLQLNDVSAADTAVYYCDRGRSGVEEIWCLYKSNFPFMKPNFLSIYSPQLLERN